MKRKILHITAILFAVILVVTYSCKKDKDDNTDNPPTSDNVAPQITITSPTAEFSYQADENTVAISGIASDNTGVTKVLFSGPGGINGTASGTQTWSVANLNLTNGDNLFTFIAYDAANNTDTAKIMVTFNEFVNFIGALNINPNGFFINTSTDVKFSIAMLNNPNLVANSIKLIKVNASGSFIEEVCELFDDGDLIAHGDDIQGDGVYGNIQNFFETSPSVMNFRVKVTTNETSGTVDSYSEISAISVVGEIPSTTLQEILDIQIAADSVFQFYAETHSFDESINQTIVWLEQQSLVVSSIQTNSGDIWIEFSFGLEGMIFTTAEGNEGGQSGIKERASGSSIPLHLQTRGTTANNFNGNKEDEHLVLDKDVLLYAPNWDEFDDWGTEFLENVNDIIAASECPNFNIVYKKNAGADLDVLKSLSEYGLIVIHTHGGLDEDNNVIFLTGEEVDYLDIPDLLDWMLGNIYPVPFHGKSMWVIKPSFLTSYNGNYPNSIVYNGSCESGYNTTMSDAFINNGASTYFGFSETVQSSFDRDMANDLFPKIITDGMTTGEAFVPGQHDNNTPAAYFVMFGDDETHFESGLTNGDFEEGYLAGWFVEGDGRTITQLGFIMPYEGNYMGIISTGLGFTVETGSISQNFCIPEGATTLSLNWNFLSEEFMEWVGSEYQDYFRISITDDLGNETELFNKTIDQIAAEYALTLVSPDIVFDQGDVYGTGWQFTSFDVTAFAGQGVTLTIAAGDVGDSYFDTAILLDDVVLE
jgi:hypothetical protein